MPKGKKKTADSLVLASGLTIGEQINQIHMEFVSANRRINALDEAICPRVAARLEGLEKRVGIITPAMPGVIPGSINATLERFAERLSQVQLDTVRAPAINIANERIGALEAAVARLSTHTKAETGTAAHSNLQYDAKFRLEAGSIKHLSGTTDQIAQKAYYYGFKDGKGESNDYELRVLAGKRRQQLECAANLVAKFRNELKQPFSGAFMTREEATRRFDEILEALRVE